MDWTASVAFLVLVLFAIPIEHLAFGRHPAWREQELARRAIGVGTIMGLGLIPVVFGDSDIRTWATLLAGFLLGGAMLAVMSRWERRQLRRTRRALNEQIRRWEKEADQ